MDSRRSDWLRTMQKLAGAVQSNGRFTSGDGSMTEAPARRSLIVERELPYRLKVWRVWAPAGPPGSVADEERFRAPRWPPFQFCSKPACGGTASTDCEVLEVVPNERLALQWNASGEQRGWPQDGRNPGRSPSSAASVRMEPAGFRSGGRRAIYRAMSAGWLDVGEQEVALDACCIRLSGRANSTPSASTSPAALPAPACPAAAGIQAKSAAALRKLKPRFDACNHQIVMNGKMPDALSSSPL